MTPRTPKIVSTVLLAGCGALLLVSAGCGSDDSSDAKDTSSTGAATSAQAADSTPVDACALLSSDDIAPIIGQRVDGRSASTDPSAPVCIWENPTTFTSVSLTVGAAGTAPNDVLPPAQPGLEGRQGPDGIRFPLAGMAEFAAGGRLSNVQVAVPSLPADKVDSTAVDFAKKAAAKLGQ